MHWFKLLIILLILSPMLPACGTASPTPKLTPITVQLRWTHQAQSAGFYAADQNGYYTAEGLVVTFLEGGPGVDVLAPVSNGTAQFSAANADSLILARAEGKPLRAIATIYRRSPAVYMALADSDIRRPQDFAGKVIEVGRNGRPLLYALTARVSLLPDQYRVVDASPDLTQFYSGQVDVRSVFLTNEVLMATAAGYELNIVYPDDYGIHFYADTIFAADDLISSQPDQVRRFLRATLKGWTYVVENPTEAGSLVTKYKPDADTAHEIAFMTASLPLIYTGEDHIGWMKPEIWAGMEKTLREQGVLTRPVDISQVYSLEFIQEIYGP